MLTTALPPLTPLLRSRIARVILVASFVIPLGTASLRGLTHVLTCDGEISTPFSIVVPDVGDPVVTTTLRLDRESTDLMCHALGTQLAARLTDSGEVVLVLPLRNESKHGWHGTVQLRLGNDTVPVDIGAVPPGSTSTEEVALRLPRGAHELTGSLLIGP